jgi:hypothetical protein
MTAYLLVVGTIRNKKHLIAVADRMKRRDLTPEVVCTDDSERIHDAILDGKPFEVTSPNGDDSISIEADEVVGLIGTASAYRNRDGVVAALRASGTYEGILERHRVDRGHLKKV